MKRHLLLFTVSVMAATVMAASTHAKSMSAQNFVHTASVANQFEIESSRIALEKSHNSDVKAFAQRMIDDHTKAGDRMKAALADSASKATPADTLDNTHKNLIDKLESSSEDSFDRQYIGMQTDAHKEAVRLFGNYSKNGKDKSLKDFASETLPTLKAHLEQVQQLKANS